jgi:hypothetical protein
LEEREGKEEMTKARKGYIFITVGHRPAVAGVISRSLPERQDCGLSPAFQAALRGGLLSAGRRPTVMKIESFQDFEPHKTIIEPIAS